MQNYCFFLINEKKKTKKNLPILREGTWIGLWRLVVISPHARRRTSRRKSSALAYPSYVYQNCVLVVSTRGCYAFPKD